MRTLHLSRDVLCSAQWRVTGKQQTERSTHPNSHDTHAKFTGHPSPLFSPPNRLWIAGRAYLTQTHTSASTFKVDACDRDRIKLSLLCSCSM
eukprot:4575590-Prymnesium_polylepis.1